MSSIELDHVNGAERLEIPVPTHGGLVVCIGANDIGKSQALQAVTRLVTGQGTVSTTRGYGGVGTVSGLGMHVAAGARTTRQGELDVDDLTSEIDLGALINPERKTPDKRDAVRIKTLVRAVGAEPDIELFGRILEPLGEIELPDAVREAEDVVTMSSRLKRRLEEVARAAAGEAEDASAEIPGLKASVENIPTDREADEAKLSAAHRAAVRALDAATDRVERKRQLEADASAALAALADLEIPDDAELDAAVQAQDVAEQDVKAKLEELEQVRAQVAEGPDASIAAIDAEEQAEIERVQADAQRRRQAVRDANRQLERAAEDATHAAFRADEAARDAKRNAENVAAVHAKGASLRDLVNLSREMTDVPDDDELARLSAEVEAAERAIVDGEATRRARDTLDQVNELAREAVAHQARADRYRRAARGTEEVLAEILRDAGLDGLEIHDSRLMTRKGAEVVPFDERSPGAQANIAFHWLVPLAKRRAGDGRPGVLVLEQRVYQELDYPHRRELAEWSDGSGVVVYSALATEGPLRVVLVSDDSDEGIR